MAQFLECFSLVPSSLQLLPRSVDKVKVGHMWVKVIDMACIQISSMVCVHYVRVRITAD